MPIYNFTLEELTLISKLPRKVAKFRDKYPLDIINAAYTWDKPPLPLDTNPDLVEVYYNDSSPAIIACKGKLKKYTAKPIGFQSNSLAVQINDEWGYIELEGEEIINRIEGLELPRVITDPVVVMSAVLALYKR